MAKVNTSKFNKVISELKESNKTYDTKFESTSTALNELNKSVNDLEYLSLLILEKVKRIEKNTTPKQKNGKLLNTKIKSANNMKAANEDLNTDSDTSSAGLLSRLYTFLVRNSDEERKEKNYRRSRTEENRKERSKKYEKESKKLGITLKETKKSGFLDKLISGLRFGFLGTIGLGLAGLIYMFKEEVLSFGKNIMSGLVTIGDSIVQLSDIMKRFSDFIVNNPLFNMMKEKLGGFFDSNKSIFSSVMEQVSNVVSSAYDSITGWIMDAFKPLLKWLENPEISLDQLKKVMLITATALVGGPARKVAMSAGSIETAADTAESARLKVMYGEDYYNETKKALDQYSDQELESRFGQEFGGRYKNYFVGSLDRNELLNSIIRDHLEHKLLSDPKMGDNENSRQRRKSVNDILLKRDKQFIDNLQTMINEVFPDKKYTVDYKEQGSGFAVYDGKEVLFDLDKMEGTMEILRLRGKKAAIEHIKNTLESAKKTIESSSLYTSTQETLAQGRDLYRESAETATRISSSASQTAGYISQQFKAEPSMAGKVGAGLSLAGEGVQRLIGSTQEAIKTPTAQKVFNYDYMGAMEDAYKKASEGFQKFSESYNQNFSTWDKTADFFDKLIEQQKSINIGDDPNAEGSVLSRFTNQIEKQVNMNNQIVTSTSSTTEEKIPTGISVRNMYDPFRVANVEMWQSVKP